jgi:arylsulfatase A-like enzyme
MNFPRLGTLLILLLMGCGRAEPPPNIVLIYVDDLGWRDAGFMGSTYYETPNIDRIAREGITFSHAYANAPNCAPSRASLMSGQYTPRHGIFTVASPARGDARLRRLVPSSTRAILDTSIVTIAEALAAGGYATAQFGKWHLGDGDFGPTGQGFGTAAGGDLRGLPPSYFYPYGNSDDALPGLSTGGREGEYLTDRLTDEALRFIDRNQDRPFFLYLSHYAVHTPLQAPDSLVEKYRAKPGDDVHNDPTYAAMIERVDAGVGRILDRLGALRLALRTVVIFYSDNGGYGPATSMAPLRGSKGMLYEGGIRVPLAVRWPGRLAPFRTDVTPVLGTDLYPTFLDLAGLDAPAGQPLDGVSLVPLLTGDGLLRPRPLFWHFPAYLGAYRGMEGPWRTTPAGAVRYGDFKLIEFFEDGRLELYNLANDPGEAHDLADEMPEKVQELHRLMQDWRQDLGAPVPTEPNPEYDP